MSTQKTRTVLLVSWQDVKSLSIRTATLRPRLHQATSVRLCHWEEGSTTGRARRTGLGRTDDVEFLHSRLKRSPLHAKFGGGALGTTDDPMGGLQRPHDMRSLGGFKRLHRMAVQARFRRDSIQRQLQFPSLRKNSG